MLPSDSDKPYTQHARCAVCVCVCFVLSNINTYGQRCPCIGLAAPFGVKLFKGSKKSSVFKDWCLQLETHSFFLALKLKDLKIIWHQTCREADLKFQSSGT